MTRIGHQNLTASNRTGVIKYDRTLEYLVAFNNNPVPLFVRLGSPEIPNELNYDIAIPPNYIIAISVNSNQFGFRLGSTSVPITQITGNTVIEATIDEPPPSLGGVPINNASLSTADLLNGVPSFSGPTVYGPFNINQWGGIIINVIPSNTSGQGVIQIDVSPDGTTWTPYQTWAFWPNIPATILTPRVSQFVRITLNATAIVGEPVIAGKIGIRGSLTEITTPSYTPLGNAIIKNWAIAALGSQQFSFVTSGLPSVSIAGIPTAGSNANAVIQLLVEASSDNVNWRQVTVRKQFGSIGITLYRSFGNLDLFIRVTVGELANQGPSNGTLYLSIPREPDTASMLNNIYQTLGDQGNPNPTGNYNDIYHELDAIRISDASVDTKLTTTNVHLNNISANTSNINLNIASGNSVFSRLDTVNTNLGITNTNLGVINASLGSIFTAIGSTNTALGVVNGHLSNIETYTSSLYQRGINQSRPITDNTNIGAASTWTRGASGVALNNGEYIIEIFFSVQLDHTLLSNIPCYVAIGPFGSVGIAMAQMLIYNNDLTGAATFSNGGHATFRFDGKRVGGYVVPFNYNYIWYNLGVTGTAAATFICG